MCSKRRCSLSSSKFESIVRKYLFKICVWAPQVSAPKKKKTNYHRNCKYLWINSIPFIPTDIRCEAIKITTHFYGHLGNNKELKSLYGPSTVYSFCCDEIFLLFSFSHQITTLLFSLSVSIHFIYVFIMLNRTEPKNILYSLFSTV